ncbi:hypothetical protein Mycsm_02146 [Mycobacterium sp. JS623]|uniref:hypothetical protein n=1 Tax=Mycobacterium sp. JS623 TaxID=212767 RepID=UPI0002A5A90C|nr:hypothetical protein [Mycobacterium sp. JS623]AGB22503.1 hypothetical protein Mycsm_02146 [Mycobacterium sp. JS623]
MNTPKIHVQMRSLAATLACLASGTIAGAGAGLGAAEVARRVLSDAEVRELVRTEIDERMTAARDFTAGGHNERAAMLRAEAAVLTDLLGDV